jgi:hypothetical protein
MALRACANFGSKLLLADGVPQDFPGKIPAGLLCSSNRRPFEEVGGNPPKGRRFGSIQ